MSPSNHHGAVRVGLFVLIVPDRILANLNTSIERDSSGFHNHVVVDGFATIQPRCNLLGRSTQRECEGFIIAVKTAIAQSS